MATMIDSTSVIRLFENNLLDYDPDKKVMTYRENGLNIEFAVPWLNTEVGSTYDLAKVRSIMGEMMRNVSHTEEIRTRMSDKDFTDKLSKEMTEFGMEYVPDTEFFTYEENGHVLFSVELEYLVSLLVINKSETVTSLLTAMRDDARRTNNGQEEAQSN